MKASVIVFKTLLIGVFLFLLSPMAFGSRLPLQIGKGFGNVLDDLKVNTEEISLDEVKFLEDALGKDPLRILEYPKAGHAIFGTSSSYVDQVYQRLFFSRLDPHSQEQMSTFFETLENYKKINFSEQDSINTWKKVTKGSVDAIQRGDFGGISLNDFRALYANHVVEKINSDTGFLETAREMIKATGGLNESAHDELIASQLRSSALTDILFNFFHGTTGISPQKVLGSGDQELTNSLFHLNNLYDEVLRAKTGKEALEALENATRHLSEEERDFLKFIDKIFTSPFLKLSIGFQGFFKVALLRNSDILKNADLILRLWNSGFQWYQKIITIEFGIQFNLALQEILSPIEFSNLVKDIFNNSRLAVISPSKVKEVYQNLMENDFTKAVMEGSRESVELSNAIEEILKWLDNSAIQNSELLH